MFCFVSVLVTAGFLLLLTEAASGRKAFFWLEQEDRTPMLGKALVTGRRGRGEQEVWLIPLPSTHGEAKRASGNGAGL